MKKLTKKSQMFLYGLSGMGVNMLNLFMGSYLCSALLIGGFSESAILNQTFMQKDLVIASVWAIFALIAKIVDGIIDIPMASFTDRLKTKWGRRRPAILIGLIPMILSFVAFLFVPNKSGATLLNTVYYGVILCIFYTSYTLTMVTYYATFTEIVETEEQRSFISNVKSVCDIVYFILGYVVVSALLKGFNIKTVSFIVLPLVLTMLIPMFLIKEDSTLTENFESSSVNVFKSLIYTFKDKNFILWMVVYFFMTFGVQLFLGGINEYFSFVNMSMIYVMIGAFAPVPLTLMLYNKIVKTKGFRFAIQYVLLIFSLSMCGLFAISFLPLGTVRTVLSIIGGIIASFAVGAIFSVAYSIPSTLAYQDELKTGISHSAMYFAVQGLFAGISTGIATGIVLTALKGTESNPTNAMTFLTLISGIACVIACAFTYILPKSIVNLGKKENK